MKILLINAPAREVKKEAIVVPPLGLAYLAAVARDAGHEVAILDAFAKGMTWHAFAEQVSRDRYDVIGFSGMTPVFDSVKRALQVCRPHARYMILGGAHATAFKTTILQDNPELDCAIFGEGEHTFLDLLEAFEVGREVSGIPGVITRDGASRGRPLISKLEELPFPARDLLPNDRYRYPLCGNRCMTTMISSRGCPYQCIFCDKGVFGSKWRARSAHNVLSEIDEAFNKYHARYIVFYDDLFVLDRDRLRELCEGLIQRAYPLAWKAEGRVDLVDAEMLTLMRRAGCDAIAYGVESANPAGLEYLGKRIPPEAAREAFRKTAEAGIKTMGYFILGIPVETYDDALRTIQFAIELNADYAQFSILSPLPGTRLYREAKEKGWYCEIAAHNVSDKDQQRPAVLSDYWTEKKLISIVHEAHSKFYLRPSYIIRSLLNVRGLGDLGNLMGMGLGVAAYVFGKRR